MYINWQHAYQQLILHEISDKTMVKYLQKVRTRSHKPKIPVVNQNLMQRMRKMENIVLCRLWSKILAQYNKTNIYLQPISMGLGNATKVLSL